MIHDLKYAIRMLLKDPAFAVVAVLSLALGTGANSTMFSFLNGVLLRPLPVVRPGEVLTITPKNPDNLLAGISYPDYVDFRDRTQTMTDLVASTLSRFGFSPSPDVLPQVKYGLIVSGNLFQAMGVTPVLGRAFRPEEGEVPGRDAVVILGYDFWTDEFGGDPGVIGRTIRLTGIDFTIVGVAPKSFTGMDELFKAAFFVPAMMIPRLSTDPQNNMLERRDWRNFGVRGRLKPGITAARAEEELAGIAKGLEQAYPATNSGQEVVLRTEMQMHVQHMPQESGVMMLAMIMGALVLLISCFNVANLLLSRARGREVALRLAIGAGRTRLVRQLLTESLLLGVAGMFAGLWFAFAAAQLFNRIKIPSDLPFMIDFRLDYRVLLFSLAAGLLSVLLFGLAPALQSSRVNLVSALKAKDATVFAGRNHSWIRNGLVVSQIAISVVVLIAATMVFRAFRTQLSGEAAPRKNNILMMTFDPRIVRYNDDQTKEFYRRLVEDAASTPGVKSVALANTMPFAVSQRVHSIDVLPEGEQPSINNEKDHVLFSAVDEHFFETMGVPILRGRGVRVTDAADAPPVAIINEHLAKKYWPHEDALGKRIQVDAEDGSTHLAEVVGIAQTMKYVWPTEAPTEYLYLPVAQRFPRQRTLFVETYGDAASLTTPIRDVVRSLDSNMPVYDVRTLDAYFSGVVVGTANISLYLVGSMGVTGLILAMIGLYGLVAYSVTRRTREFGIRIAIGASSTSVLGMVLRQGTLLCAAGLAVGIAISVPASRLLQAVVFADHADWVPYVLVPSLLLLVTLLATYGPARRASMIAPTTALRDE